MSNIRLLMKAEWAKKVGTPSKRRNHWGVEQQTTKKMPLSKGTGSFYHLQHAGPNDSNFRWKTKDNRGQKRGGGGSKRGRGSNQNPTDS